MRAGTGSSHLSSQAEEEREAPLSWRGIAATTRAFTSRSVVHMCSRLAIFFVVDYLVALHTRIHWRLYWLAPDVSKPLLRRDAILLPRPMLPNLRRAPAPYTHALYALYTSPMQHHFLNSRLYSYWCARRAHTHARRGRRTCV